MRTSLAIVLLASVFAGSSPALADQPERGLKAVNQPVVTRTDYTMDVAAPDGTLASSEEARLDGWFQGLGLGYGDRIYVDGDYAGAAATGVARVAGRYGMMVSAGSPVTAGGVQPGTVVLLSAAPGPAFPAVRIGPEGIARFKNRQMSNYGCAVSSNFAAMIADPQDLVYGRDGGSVVDASTAAKAIHMYRDWPLTGVAAGVSLRPLDQTTTKEGN